jgi:hypothetical protein
LLKHSVASPQAVPFSFLHVPMPLHEFVPVQLGESSTPKGTLEHVPTAPMTLQAEHVAVHVELQQTPSTQNPLTHSPLAAQVLPISPLHALDPLHDPGLHSFCGSDPFTIGPHVPFVPCPLRAAVHAWHVPPHAVLQQTPSTQKLLKHSAPAAQVCAFSFLQVPIPSQVFVPTQFGESSMPTPTFEQVPMLPVMLQAWQVVLHAVLQQTPSAQKLLRQSPAAAHG